MNPVIVQGFGVAAMLIAVTIYQTNTRRAMLLLSMTACLLWTTHFVLLGATTGAAMNLLGASRAYTFLKVKPTKSNRWVMRMFAGFLVLATFLTWQGPLSLLPLMGSMFGVIGDWQKQPRMIRRLNFGSSPPWLIYDFISGSYPGVTVEVLRMASNLIGQYRFDIGPSTRKRLTKVFRPV